MFTVVPVDLYYSMLPLWLPLGTASPLETTRDRFLKNKYISSSLTLCYLSALDLWNKQITAPVCFLRARILLFVPVSIALGFLRCCVDSPSAFAKTLA